MIESRRWARPMRRSASTQSPAPSGPRCATASRIASSSRSSTGCRSGAKERMPANPHMLLDRPDRDEHAPMLGKPARDPVGPVLDIVGGEVGREGPIRKLAEERAEFPLRIGLGADALEMVPQ